MAASMIGAASGGGRHRRRRRAVMSEIIVTPFVDVMLVLLIVFMVSAPLMTLPVGINLPNARGGSVSTESDKTSPIVKLKKTGGACDSTADLRVGESTVSPSDLDAILRALKNSTEQPPSNVIIQSDRDVCYKEIMTIGGIISAAGFTPKLAKLPEE